LNILPFESLRGKLLRIGIKKLLLFGFPLELACPQVLHDRRRFPGGEDRGATAIVFWDVKPLALRSSADTLSCASGR
jgi:hypothetical protein